MLKGKKIGGIEFANGNSVEFINMGQDTVSNLSAKLQAALEDIENLKTALHDLEARIQMLEQ